MRDEKYIEERKRNNDWILYEKNLYYSIKNENYIIPTILICAFLALTYYGIVKIIIVLAFVYYLCWSNNRELDNSPSILKRREEYKQTRIKLEKDKNK